MGLRPGPRHPLELSSLFFLGLSLPRVKPVGGSRDSVPRGRGWSPSCPPGTFGGSTWLLSVSSAVSSAWPLGPSPAHPNSRLLCPHAVALPSRRGSPGLAWGHPVCDLRPAQAARVPRSPGRARVPPAFRELPDALGELRPGDSESRRGLGLGPGPRGLGGHRGGGARPRGWGSSAGCVRTVVGGGAHVSPTCLVGQPLAPLGSGPARHVLSPMLSVATTRAALVPAHRRGGWGPPGSPRSSAPRPQPSG